MKTQAPEALELEQKVRIWAWVRERHPFFTKEQLREEWERCRDWHLANDKRRSSWEATFRNWIRKAADFSARDHRGARPASRTVAIRSSSDGDSPPGALEPLGQVFRKLL